VVQAQAAVAATLLKVRLHFVWVDGVDGKVQLGGLIREHPEAIANRDTLATHWISFVEIDMV